MMIDWQGTFFLKVKLVKGNLALEAADDAMFAIITMHSLFSNCEICCSNEQVYTSNGLYLHKAFISDECFITKGTRRSICACQCYRYEIELASFGDEPFLSRKAKKKVQICFYGKLAIVFFFAINSYSPASKSGYVQFAPDQFPTLSPIRTEVFHVLFSKRPYSQDKF